MRIREVELHSGRPLDLPVRVELRPVVRRDGRDLAVPVARSTRVTVQDVLSPHWAGRSSNPRNPGPRLPHPAHMRPFSPRPPGPRRSPTHLSSSGFRGGRTVSAARAIRVSQTDRTISRRRDGSTSRPWRPASTPTRFEAQFIFGEDRPADPRSDAHPAGDDPLQGATGMSQRLLI